MAESKLSKQFYNASLPILPYQSYTTPWKMLQNASMTLHPGIHPPYAFVTKMEDPSYRLNYQREHRLWIIMAYSSCDCLTMRSQKLILSRSNIHSWQRQAEIQVICRLRIFFCPRIRLYWRDIKKKPLSGRWKNRRQGLQERGKEATAKMTTKPTMRRKIKTMTIKWKRQWKYK